MSKGFRFLEDIALADLAFEAWGETPTELFVAASEGLAEAMANPNTVDTIWQQDIQLSQGSLKDLLFDWLSQLVFLKDAESVVFHGVQVQVWEDTDQKTWQVRGTVLGEPIDQTRQELRADVKAVTKHMYEVEEHPGRYRTRVVLDV